MDSHLAAETAGRKKGKKAKKAARVEDKTEEGKQSPRHTVNGTDEEKLTTDDIAPEVTDFETNTLPNFPVDTGVALETCLIENSPQTESSADEYRARISTLETQLSRAHFENKQLDDKYKGLLGRVASIRTTLTDRLKQDAEELQQTKSMVEDLEEQNRNLLAEKQRLEVDLIRATSDKGTITQALDELRERLSISQQNWTKERDEAGAKKSHIQKQLDQCRKSVQDWEVLAMEESSVRRALEERCQDLEEQQSSQRDLLEEAESERGALVLKVSDLQDALSDIQRTRKEELRSIVDTTQTQIERLSQEKSQWEERALKAESESFKLSEEFKRVSHFEGEVKEKTLLIGKLRHQAVILNEHLTKALRMIKKGDSQDNVDRQLVTNLFLSFLGLPRGDAKRYEVLQLIANYLRWSEEDRETAGLSRPSGPVSSLSGSIPSRSMQSPVAQLQLGDAQDNFPGGSDNLAELWALFLQQQTDNK